MKIIRKTVMFSFFILVICSVASAKNIENKTLNLSYNISDNWKETDRLNCYRYQNSTFESFFMECSDLYSAYSIDQLSEYEWEKLNNKFTANRILADSLEKANHIPYINITVDSVVTGYEYHRGVKYYRYEKLYTAHAVGYHDKQLYITIYSTVKNGKTYVFEYERDMDENHFSEFIAVLDSLIYDDTVKILVDGKRIYPDSDPVIINGHTLVPIRAVAEEMNYSVAWDGENQLTILSSLKGDNVLNFGIGKNVALRNLGQPIKLDVPATIIENRTYLPLRAVIEAMDAEVIWNESEKTVDIISKFRQRM